MVSAFWLLSSIISTSFCKQNLLACHKWGSGRYHEALCRGDALAWQAHARGARLVLHLVLGWVRKRRSGESPGERGQASGPGSTSYWHSWQNEGVGAGKEIGMGAIKCLLSNYFSHGSSDPSHNYSIKLQPENWGEVSKTLVLLILSVCQCSDQALIPPSSCFFSCFCCSVPTIRTGGSTCHPSRGSLHSGPWPAIFSCLDCFPIPCLFIDSGTPLCPHLTMWPRPVPMDGPGGGAAFAAIVSHLPWPRKH